MSFGICINSLIPVRTEPSHRSEMNTELLFGELYSIVDTLGDWLHIRMIFDNYEGFINRSSHFSISEDEFRRLHDLPCRVSTDLVQLVENRSLQLYYPILMGSTLQGMSDNIFSYGEHEFIFDGLTQSLPQSGERKLVTEMSMMYLNSPYRWGGRSPFGIDCSGFTQMAYKIAGIQLLRDASQQATQGETLSFISDASPGDLLFFDDEEGMITHTGILLSNGRIIHASGKVRIDKVDHEGIFNVETGNYSHKLRLIKKIL